MRVFGSSWRARRGTVSSDGVLGPRLSQLVTANHLMSRQRQLALPRMILTRGSHTRSVSRKAQRTSAQCSLQGNATGLSTQESRSSCTTFMSLF